MIPCTEGKYGRRLYCDHVAKCFVSRCVIQVANIAVHRHLDDTFRDKAFCRMITIQVATILALCVWNVVLTLPLRQTCLW